MTDQNQKKRTGMASLAAAGEGEDFSVIDAIGGPRGVIESMLPGVLFVVLFVVTSNLNLVTIGVSAALAVLTGRHQARATAVGHGRSQRPDRRRHLPDMGVAES